MEKIKRISKQTDNKFLNLYELDGRKNNGKPINYFIASRAGETEELKINTRDARPDGVIIYSVHGEKKDKVVLVRQYRYSIDGYIYEFPAGLVEKGEDMKEAAVREMKEETGLDLEPVDAGDMYEKPCYTTIGMTDECCGTIYGYTRGTPNTSGLEESEELEVVLADKKEVRRILKEERVAIMCAYMLMHFLKSQGDPLDFLK